MELSTKEGKETWKFVFSLSFWLSFPYNFTSWANCVRQDIVIRASRPKLSKMLSCLLAPDFILTDWLKAWEMMCPGGSGACKEAFISDSLQGIRMATAARNICYNASITKSSLWHQLLLWILPHIITISSKEIQILFRWLNII